MLLLHKAHCFSKLLVHLHLLSFELLFQLLKLVNFCLDLIMMSLVQLISFNSVLVVSLVLNLFLLFE